MQWQVEPGKDAQVWTVRRVLQWTQGYLAQKGDACALRSAQALVSDACGLSRLELYLDLDRPLEDGERARLRAVVYRRAAGEPLQYILGKQAFRFLEFKVAPGVLIPRPETEVLVSEALACLSDYRKGHAARFSSNEETPDVPEETHYKEQEQALMLAADIGCGCGCIAASLAFEQSDLCVYAVDISQAARDLAEENMRLLGLERQVMVLKGDLCEPLLPSGVGKFALVVSNPPYVPTSLLSNLSSEVIDFEPALALDGGHDGLSVFRRLLPQAFRLLRDEGSFVCELHEESLEEARALAIEAGFVQLDIVKDLAEKPRVLVAKKA